MALLGAGGIGAEQQEGTLARQAQLQARLLAADRLEAIEIHAARQHSGAASGSTGDPCGKFGGDGRGEVDAAEDRPCGQPRARVGEVGAVHRQRPHPGGDHERWPGGQAEVRVYDVELRCMAEARAQLASGGEQRAGTRRELVQLDLDAVEPAQRGHLVADEAAALGVAGIGPHVRDHECPQDPPTVALWNDAPRARRRDFLPKL